jgi:hypothetical protein
MWSANKTIKTFLWKGVAMKSTKFILMAALILTSMSPTGWADTKPGSPNVTVHQQLAGELDDTGWTTAVSTQGGFLVRTPTKYNDTTEVNDQPRSPVDRAHSISALTLQGVKFTARRIHYKPDTKGARAQFDKFKVSAGKLRYKSVKPMKMNDNEALEGEVETPRAAMVQRVILMGDDLFMMVVEYPRVQDAVAKRQIPIFFESVKFD